MDDVLIAMLPTLIEVGVPLLTTALGIVGTAALAAVRRYFNHAAADRLLDRLERATVLAVHDVEQTLVPGLIAASADGKITRVEAIALRKSASVRVRKLMSSKAMRELGSELGEDLDEIIGHTIEAKVKQMRNATREI